MAKRIHDDTRRQRTVAPLLGSPARRGWARRWRGLTVDLKPGGLVDLIGEPTAVLHGIGLGVLAVDESWNTTFVNDEACRLLDVTAELGRPIDEIGLTRYILDVFTSPKCTPAMVTVGERILMVMARAVVREGCRGAMLIIRDRTDVELLRRQLDAVQSMSAVLRAQRHEFVNRLHLLSGLIQCGRLDEATCYLDELLDSGPLGSAVPGIDAIHDPYLHAFLAAKAAHAREAGVALLVGPNTYVPGTLAVPVDATTVLGNVLDNAIEAARIADNDTKRVQAELVQERCTLHISVADSGDGVAPEFVARLFTEGSSTRADGGIPGGRGIGLALSRRMARALGGDLRLSSPASATAALRGAEFIAHLPGVMLQDEPVWVTQN